MNRKMLFITATAGLVTIILLLFFLTGHRNSQQNAALDLSAEEEESLITEMHELDSLFAQFENAAYKGGNASIQSNLSWQKGRQAFITKHQANPVTAQLAALVIENYRRRLEMVEKNRNAMSLAFEKAEKVREAIAAEQAKNEALKTDNILIKEALLKL